MRRLDRVDDARERGLCLGRSRHLAPHDELAAPRRREVLRALGGGDAPAVVDAQWEARKAEMQREFEPWPGALAAREFRSVLDEVASVLLGPLVVEVIA